MDCVCFGAMGNEAAGTVIDAYAHLDMSRPNPGQDLLERISEAGLQRAVVVETWDGRNREWVKELVDRYSATCCGVFCFKPENNDLLFERLRVANVIGIRMRTAELNSAEAMVSHLEESRKWLVVHAEAGIGMLCDGLLRLVVRHPHLRVYIPHLGWPQRAGQEDPEWSASVRELADVSGCIAGISAIATFSNQLYPHADVRKFAAQICELFGADRLVLGSDYPMPEGGVYSAYIELARSWFQTLTGRDSMAAEHELCPLSNIGQ